MRNHIPDFEKPNKMRCSFNYSTLIQDLYAPANLIVEIRAVDN